MLTNKELDLNYSTINTIKICLLRVTIKSEINNTKD